MPLSADQVDINRQFDNHELLYRRVSKLELGENFEVDPSRIEAISFRGEVQSSPSVMRGAFSEPHDVLHYLCAGRDVSDWLVFSLRVEQLPQNVQSGDRREFRFFPKHIPEPNCGAHSVVACCYQTDPTNVYVKPSKQVIWEFKVRFATSLVRVPRESGKAKQTKFADKIMGFARKLLAYIGFS